MWIKKDYFLHLLRTLIKILKFKLILPNDYINDTFDNKGKYLKIVRFILPQLESGSSISTLPIAKFDRHGLFCCVVKYKVLWVRIPLHEFSSLPFSGTMSVHLMPFHLTTIHLMTFHLNPKDDISPNKISPEDILVKTFWPNYPSQALGSSQSPDQSLWLG
jgi:hypothetical protein